MSSLNRIILIGRLTKDPEVRTTTTGLSVASFRIAVDRPVSSQNGQKESDFFSVTAWRQTADYVANYLGKGRLVAVEGRLQNREWVGQDGQKRYDVEVVADRVAGLDRARDGEDGGGGGRSETPVGARASSQGGESSGSNAPADDFEDSSYDPFADD